jgi:hypothetical protein
MEYDTLIKLVNIALSLPLLLQYYFGKETLSLPLTYGLRLDISSLCAQVYFLFASTEINP